MVHAKSKKTAGLGNALMNDRFGKGRGADRKKSTITRVNHATGEEYLTNERQEASWVKMRSVTEQGALDEFLATAELAGTDFTAEKMNNVKIIHTDQKNPYLLSGAEERAIIGKQKAHRGRLTVPRRPKWDASTTPEELDRRERESFLDWRRGLAELQENNDLLMTPFERNLEVWRQLWRVIERSDLIVQIVDARNPLLFRSEDLEHYVKDIDSKKENLLLINKADMLTLKQRKMWAKYLKENGIAYRFFSAHLAKELLEAMESDDESEDEEPEAGSSSNAATKDAASAKEESSEEDENEEEKDDKEDGGAETAQPEISQPEAEADVDDEDTRILTVEELEEIFLSHAPENAAVYGIKIKTRAIEEGGTGTPTAPELLRAYARARGFQTQGLGQPDESRASRYILKDYVAGKLLYCEPPPGTVEGPEFNAELYDETHLPEKRRRALSTSMDTMSIMDDDISIAPSDLAALPAGPKSKQIDKGFFGPNSSGGHTKMPFSHKYTEQGQKHLSGRKARAMIALESGVDPKDVKLSSGKKHFKGELQQLDDLLSASPNIPTKGKAAMPAQKQITQPEEAGESSTSAAKKALTAASNGVPNYELPWVEKYRPVFLDDVVGNTETIDRLKIIAKEGNMPHVIISGMPGIGKTTSVLCLARQLLGDTYKEAVLELNASDERGIDVVRNRIKGFAQKKVTLPQGRHKLVILDEADSMTSGAQQALRRTMEIYSNTTRFAFACNQSNKIIEPLQSRCAILRYARLTDEQVVKRLLQIIEAEKVEYSDDGLAALVFSAEGDMRQAINNLQSTFAGFGFVSGDNVFKVVDSPHPIKVQAMLKACYEGNVDSALECLRELWDLGYSSHDIISTMFKVTKTIPTLSEHSKLEFIKEIGFTHMKILEGVQTLLQLSGCVARLCKLNMDPKRFEAASK
ncbi:replication factor C [Colletotrichum abscissum]